MLKKCFIACCNFDKAQIVVEILYRKHLVSIPEKSFYRVSQINIFEKMKKQNLHPIAYYDVI